jgi:hypothetical protein
MCYTVGMTTTIPGFGTQTAEQDARREARLMPARRARVAARCPDGHTWSRLTPPGDPRRKCNRCSYYECELVAWGLAPSPGRG